MNDLDWYLEVTYINIRQPSIMTKTPENLTDPDIPTIIPETGSEHPKTDGEIKYIKKKNIDEAIRQKIRNKDVYETDMHNIYNFIVDQKKDKLQEKWDLEATFQAVK